MTGIATLAAWNMNLKMTWGQALAAAVVATSLWVVHGFLEAVLSACVIAIASWPIYRRFTPCLPRQVGRRTAATLFTVVMTVFVLAPMVLACIALLGEASSLVADIAAADSRGISVPGWLASAPAIGPWLRAHWQGQLDRPGALSTLTQHADPAALLSWVQSFGEFAMRHALTLGFSILLLGFLYQEGDLLAEDMTAALRRAIGDVAEHYVRVGTRAVRAAVSSMLFVGLFDGCATALAFALAGAPRALVWAAITGALAAVPFLGYVAVGAMALSIAIKGATTPALLSLLYGAFVLLCGDKLIRPLVARGGIRLPFAWVLIGCVGGFGTLGLAGLVIGPLALSLAHEIWEREIRGNGA